MFKIIIMYFKRILFAFNGNIILMFKIIIHAFQMDINCILMTKIIIHVFQKDCICILMKYYFNV